MGHYLEGLPANDKANFLVKNYKATIINGRAKPEDARVFLTKDHELALICVVQNYTWDAAAIVYNSEEFQRFLYDMTGRPKTWLVMPREVVGALHHSPIPWGKSLAEQQREEWDRRDEDEPSDDEDETDAE